MEEESFEEHGMAELQKIPYKSFESQSLFKEKLENIQLKNFAPNLAIHGKSKIELEVAELKKDGVFKILK